MLLRYSAASVIDTSSKYKFLWKLPLEEVEVVKSKAPCLITFFLSYPHRTVEFNEPHVPVQLLISLVTT